MIVCDASVIVSGLENDGSARLLLAAGDLQVPHLVDHEVLHAFRGRVRGGLVEAEPAKERLDAWLRIGARRHSVMHLVDRIWELRDNLSAYDAGYVALAEALRCPLATGDRRIARAPGTRCEMIVIDH